MPHIRMKGLNQVAYRRADGSRAVYWYAWKGGPRLPGAPGDPDFVAAYAAAVEARRAPPADTLRALVVDYKKSPEWTRLSAATRKEWIRWLDRIMETAGPLAIGDLPFKALDDRRARAEILAWRDQWAASPRSADYAIQVLARVLSWGMKRGRLALNVAAGVEQLYSADRSDQIWTADEIKAFADAAPSPEVGYIVRLAALTGLRRADLAALQWAQVGELAIVRRTAKSRGQRVALVMLLPETQALLDEIRTQAAIRRAELVERAAKRRRPPPPIATTVLTNTRGLPWTANGLEHQVVDVKTKAGVKKHLHDLRGTFVTRLRRAGLTGPEIADTVGWTETRVERLLSVYVDMNERVTALAERIRKAEA